MKNEKGQYRIVNEIFVFAIGILVAVFVMMSFQDLEKKTEEYAARDQLTGISNIVFSGILKTAEVNSTIKLHVPSSAGRYRISAKNNYLIVSLVENPSINVTRFLNMEEYNINGDVSAEYIEISSSNKAIRIRGLV